MPVIEATASTFDELSVGTVVIDFWATWCGPCKTMSPIVESASGMVAATFLSVDVDAQRALVDRFNVRSMPTFVVLKDGEEVGRFRGAMPYDKFLVELYKLIS